MSRWLPCCAVLLTHAVAFATGVSAQRVTAIAPTEQQPVDAGVDVVGEARLRLDTLHNLDLDRGLTPSGRAFYPVPLSDTDAQNLQRADFRLRTDLNAHTAGGTMGVQLRLDVLDNMPLGGDADFDGVVVSQRPPRQRALVVQRAFAYALSPVGVVAAGRMGNRWGLGILANSGDCRGCDGATSTDRISFATPLVGHMWAVSYDFSASGPFAPSRDGRSLVDLDPETNMRAVVFAVDKTHTPLMLMKRRAGDRLSLEYGGYYTHGWQSDDVGVQRLPTAEPVEASAALVQERGLSADSFSLWARLTTRSLRAELEAVLVTGTIEQPSLIPGLVIEEAVEITTYGAALEVDYGAAEDRHLIGLKAGVASDDDAPGFGAFPRPGDALPQDGDLDGAQADLVDDFTVENFRFHPDYQIDRIFFREILGTVTGAAYARLEGSYDLVRNGNFRIVASLGVVGSMALSDATSPGDGGLLGVELDPTLAYLHSDGFELALEQATFVPLAGLDNTERGWVAQPAQLWRLRARFAF